MEVVERNRSLSADNELSASDRRLVRLRLRMLC